MNFTAASPSETMGSLERSGGGSSSGLRMVKSANIQTTSGQQHVRGVNNVHLSKNANRPELHTRTIQSSRVATTKTAKKRGNTSLTGISYVKKNYKL